MSKVYARQIRPEYQESPFELWGCPDNIIMPGNRTYRSHNVDHPAYRHIMDYLEEMIGAWEEDSTAYYTPVDGSSTRFVKTTKPHSLTIAEILRDYHFEREDGKPWTNQQKHTWRMLMESDDYTEDGAMLEAMRLITGKEWDICSINGCCQGDWAEVIFPVDEYSREDLDRLEADYFNLGTEWIIHDEREAPETPADVSGYSVYCYACSDDGIKKEIAAVEGVQPEDVELYFWTGDVVEYKYRIA